MILYVYDADTRVMIARVHGESNAECERKAAEANYDDSDRYGWTYSPAIGSSEGLVDSADAVEI